MIKTIVMCPSRATYYATAERKVRDHPVTITERNCRDGSINDGKCTAWKPVLQDRQHMRVEKEKFTLFSDHNGSLLRRQPRAHISMTVYLAICQGLLHTAAGLLPQQAQRRHPSRHDPAPNARHQSSSTTAVHRCAVRSAEPGTALHDSGGRWSSVCDAMHVNKKEKAQPDHFSKKQTDCAT